MEYLDKIFIPDIVNIINEFVGDHDIVNCINCGHGLNRLEITKKYNNFIINNLKREEKKKLKSLKLIRLYDLRKVRKKFENVDIKKLRCSKGFTRKGLDYFSGDLLRDENVEEFPRLSLKINGEKDIFYNGVCDNIKIFESIKDVCHKYDKELF